MMGINHEETCKDIFSRYLFGGLALAGSGWEEHPNGKNRPPDFTFKIGSDEFAVEITRFKDIREYEGKKINTVTAESYRIRFIEEIEQEAIKSGILSGVYAISFHLSWLPEPTPKVRREVKTQVLSRIRDSNMLTDGPPTQIRLKSGPFCEISKIADKGSKIYPTFTDAAWEESPELTQHVLMAFSESLRLKVKTLRRHRVPEPWILIFHNAYPLASEHVYRKYVIPFLAEDMKAFHSVFIVNSQDSGFMLSSIRAEWLSEVK